MYYLFILNFFFSVSYYREKDREKKRENERGKGIRGYDTLALAQGGLEQNYF
jgi:hypothetical protein